MRASKVNTIAAYMFLVLTISTPLILYNKLTKSRALFTYLHNLQDKCKVPDLELYEQNIKYHYLNDYVQSFNDLSHDKAVFLARQQELFSNSSYGDARSLRKLSKSLKKFKPTRSIEKTFNSSRDYSQDGQSSFVDKYFKEIECGTFVEVGAADGVDFSNTLYLEAKRNWHGYLIEANRELYGKMISEDVYRPNSIKINACVGPVTYTGATVDLPFNFQPLGKEETNFLGGLSMYLEMSKTPDLREVYASHFGGQYTDVKDTLTCINLEKLLPSNITIDYLSLDTEGSEIPIIESVREEFWRDQVRLVSVDVSSAGGSSVRADNSRNMQLVFKNLGFKLVESLKHDDIYANEHFPSQ